MIVLLTHYLVRFACLETNTALSLCIYEFIEQTLSKRKRKNVAKNPVGEELQKEIIAWINKFTLSKYQTFAIDVVYLRRSPSKNASIYASEKQLFAHLRRVINKNACASLFFNIILLFFSPKNFLIFFLQKKRDKKNFNCQ